MAAVFPPPANIFSIHLSTDDMLSLVFLVEQVAATTGDPDRIAAVRINEVDCCIEMDIAERPVDPHRLH